MFFDCSIFLFSNVNFLFFFLSSAQTKIGLRGTAGSTPAQRSKTVHRRDSSVFSSTPITGPRPPCHLGFRHRCCSAKKEADKLFGDTSTRFRENYRSGKECACQHYHQRIGFFLRCESATFSRRRDGSTTTQVTTFCSWHSDTHRAHFIALVILVSRLRGGRW